MKTIADEFNACIDSDFGVALIVREVDVIRDKSDYMVSASFREAILKEVLAEK